MANVPHGQTNLYVTVSDDGVWLHFETDSNLQFGINVEHEAEKRKGKGQIGHLALTEWCKIMRESVDNG